MGFHNRRLSRTESIAHSSMNLGGIPLTNWGDRHEAQAGMEN